MPAARELAAAAPSILGVINFPEHLRSQHDGRCSGKLILPGGRRSPNQCATGAGYQCATGAADRGTFLMPNDISAATAHNPAAPSQAIV